MTKMKLFKLDEDALAVARAKDGSAQDLYFLWQKYQDRIYRLVRFRVGNELDAETVMGKILDNFLKGFAKFKGHSSFKTYLFTIVNNALTDFFKKEKNRPVMVNIDSVKGVAAPLPESEKDYQSDKVYLILGQLKPIYRDVLFYYYFENLPFKEIGRIMNKKEATVRKLAQRAREEFYQLYEKAERRNEVNEKE